MSWFRREDRNVSHHPPPQAQYEVRIQRFMERVGDSGSKWYHALLPNEFKPDVDPLERLFSWGYETNSERNDLRTQAHNDALKISRLESELKTATEKLLQLEDRAQQLEALHRSKVDQYETEIRRVQAQHVDTISHMREKHDTQIDHLKTTHNSTIQKTQDVHRSEVRKLVGELLVNQDDNTAWTDEKLKIRYRNLQTLISSLVSPRNNKHFRIPKDARVSRDIDPTGFLVRASNAKAHFLLQSRIWSILCHHFFSAPYGFGVLGQDEAQSRLLNMFLSWIRLLGKSSEEVSKIYEIIGQNQIVNNWRATTFQCINDALMLDETQSSAASIAALAAKNVSRARQMIMRDLEQVLSVPDDSTLPALNEQVHRLCLEAEQVAMQFGLHAARLQLFVPGPSDEVRIGSEIHDCEDGDINRGSAAIVELVTLPGFQVIGDGRTDFSSRRTLVPGEFYPR